MALPQGVLSRPRDPFALSPTHLKAFFPIHTLDPLVVVLPALASQQYGQPSIPKPTPLAGKRVQPFPKWAIVAISRDISAG